MRLPWRRARGEEGQPAEFAQVETAAGRMREALVPLNEQLHGLASHISSIRAALSAPGRAQAPPASVAALEAALAAAEEAYERSLRIRDGILRQAEGLQSQAQGVRAQLGALTTREACTAAALQAEDRVRSELDALTEANARLQARVEVAEL